MLLWALRKKGITEVLVRSVMSLYEGAKSRVGVDSELSEEFEIKVGMRQESMLSSFLFVVVADAVTEFFRDGVISELLYGDDLVLIRETIEGLRNKCIKWMVAFESKGL